MQLPKAIERMIFAMTMFDKKLVILSTDKAYLGGRLKMVFLHEYPATQFLWLIDVAFSNNMLVVRFFHSWFGNNDIQR